MFILLFACKSFCLLASLDSAYSIALHASLDSAFSIVLHASLDSVYSIVFHASAFAILGSLGKKKFQDNFPNHFEDVELSSSQNGPFHPKLISTFNLHKQQEQTL